MPPITPSRIIPMRSEDAAMPELTLESLARRIDALEAVLVTTPPKDQPAKDWRRVVGMFADSEFMREVDEECRRSREEEREAARREPDPG